MSCGLRFCVKFNVINVIWGWLGYEVYLFIIKFVIVILNHIDSLVRFTF